MSSDNSKKTLDNAPREHVDIEKSVRRGLIIVHTGKGKGKSTAAFGTALRAMGRGKKVAIVQFIKGKWITGESKFFDQYPGLCQMHIMGDGFTWDTKDYEQDVKTAQRTWAKCKEFLHDSEHFLVIFDEINYVMKFNFLDPKEIIDELKRKPALKHVILTGNGAPQELIDLADLVTEMNSIKHPYQQGIKAQPGIEY